MKAEKSGRSYMLEFNWRELVRRTHPCSASIPDELSMLGSSGFLQRLIPKFREIPAGIKTSNKIRQMPSPSADSIQPEQIPELSRRPTSTYMQLVHTEMLSS